MSTEKLPLLLEIARNASIARPEGVLQESAARGLVDLAQDAITALRSSQGLDDIEAIRLRKKAQTLRTKVHDLYLLGLFDTFDALLKKRD